MDAAALKENAPPRRASDVKRRALERSGPRKTVYWVGRKPAAGGAAGPGLGWRVGAKYKGDWQADVKHGFGILQYPNRDVYKGKFACGAREGEGALWTVRDGKLQRGYTGLWRAGRREGRGTAAYADGARYEGYWRDNHREGFGRLTYPSGDAYFGGWAGGARSGYGVMVYANGDNYEGMWLADRKEGRGSFLHAKRGALFVGEWAADTPAAGVYADVAGQPTPGPLLPPLGLAAPLEVLEAALEAVRSERLMLHARTLPVEVLFEPEDLEPLAAVFGRKSDGAAGLATALSEFFGTVDADCVVQLCAQLGFATEGVTLDLFSRLVFVFLETEDHGE